MQVALLALVSLEQDEAKQRADQRAAERKAKGK
jgi:hypothetical protein